MIAIVSWAIENNLVYLRSILVCDCNSYSGHIHLWACDYDSFLLGNNLLYLRSILVRPVIVIVFWSYPLVGL